MKKQQKQTISLAPKGLILLALGGYVKAETDKTVEMNTNAVVGELAAYLKANNLCVAVIDNTLEFMPFRIEQQRKKFLGIF